ncbi:MAG: PaaI family thioesterase [Chloroflexi bacterium]|nr:PaaI family thioesterase [Chloroflexota bacterium]
MTAERSAREELLAAIDGLSEERARVVLGWLDVFRRGGATRAKGEGESVGTLEDLLGIVAESRQADGARMRFTVDPALNNPNGVVHGGIIYTMVDYSMGRAVQYGLPEGEHCATIEIKISYLASVREGTVTVETEIVKQGRTIAFLASKVTDDQDRLVATASGSMFIFRAEGQPVRENSR